MAEEQEQRFCIDCGNESTGLRCKACHGLEMQRRALAETAKRDAELLAMVDEGLSGQRLADRLHISRTRVRTRLADARKRTALRNGVG